MRRLIDSLLELARLDAGEELPRGQPCDLAAITADALELAGKAAAERGIQIHAELGSAVCSGDGDRLAQVSHESSQQCNRVQSRRRRSACHHSGQNGTVTLTVRNTGPGIAVEDLPSIFERFYRADTARNGRGAHTGLGLAIVKAIVQSHGGNIERQAR